MTIPPPNAPQTLQRFGTPVPAAFTVTDAGTAPPTAYEKEARKAAEQLVAQTLITPILRELRESSNAAPPFAPTEAEKQFGALLDQRIAEDLTRASGFPIVDRLARDLLQRQVTEASPR